MVFSQDNEKGKMIGLDICEKLSQRSRNLRYNFNQSQFDTNKAEKTKCQI